MRWRWRDRPTVSIVVATHNRASLLPLALDSAIGQDYPRLEVLVLDDGSTDATREVLADYARRVPRERFRFESQANIGQALTLNRGYSLARGELLGYLSDDDLLAPQLVSTLVRALIRRPDAAAAYPAYRLIDAHGRIIDTWLPLQYTPTTALTHHDTIIGPGGLARREALEASGGWDPRYRFIGDLIMWMGVARSGPVLRIERPLASWRKHPDGATSATGVSRAAEHLRVFEHGLELDPTTARDPALRAEALRNACATAAWFARQTEFAPGEPVSMIDQDRPLLSAWSSGQDPATTRFDIAAARRVAAALRRLGELTLELAGARGGAGIGAGGGAGIGAGDGAGIGARGGAGIGAGGGASDPPGGYRRALERLRAVGALGGRPRGGGCGLDAGAFGSALIAAALDCAAEVPARQRRFLIPDRRQSELAAAEIRVLAELTMSGPAHGRGMIDALDAEIARRRADLAGAVAAAGRGR